MDKQSKFLLLVQTLVLEFNQFHHLGPIIPAYILFECMRIPVGELPEGKRLFDWAIDYVSYSYGERGRPDWLKEEWK